MIGGVIVSKIVFLFTYICMPIMLSITYFLHRSEKRSVRTYTYTKGVFYIVMAIITLQSILSIETSGNIISAATRATGWTISLAIMEGIKYICDAIDMKDT